MRVLIVEDEPPIADYIKDLVRSFVPSKVERIDAVHTLRDAEKALAAGPIDLCLLDLNLTDANGYDILKTAVSKSFHTIIVSVHTDQAVEAFGYGVLDFVPKPIQRERMKRALDRFFSVQDGSENRLRYLVVRKQRANHLLAVEQIMFFEAERYLVKAHLKNGKQEYVEKPLNRLTQILPKNFLRVHRSYIVSLDEIASYRHKRGGSYEILLKSGKTIPMGPSTKKTMDRMILRKN